jgi:uncharacterized protein (DUF58 family)
MWYIPPQQPIQKAPNDSDLKELRKIHIHLGRKVDSPFVGEYRSTFRGQGMEFEDVRIYEPGDDIRRIDWNVTARTGVPHIKQYRESRERTIAIVCDASASMRWGGNRSKRLQMAKLAGIFAYSALRSGDRLSFLRYSDHIETFLPAKKGQGHVWGIIKESFNFSGKGRGTKTDIVVDHVLRHLPRRSVIIWLSDFLISDITHIQRLQKRYDIHSLLIYDQRELTLDKDIGWMMTQDMESGMVRKIHTQSIEPMDLEEKVKELRGLGCKVATIECQSDSTTEILRYFRGVL